MPKVLQIGPVVVPLSLVFMFAAVLADGYLARKAGDTTSVRGRRPGEGARAPVDANPYRVGQSVTAAPRSFDIIYIV